MNSRNEEEMIEVAEYVYSFKKNDGEPKIIVRTIEYLTALAAGTQQWMLTTLTQTPNRATPSYQVSISWYTIQ